MKSVVKSVITCVAAWTLLALFVLGVLTFLRIAGLPETVSGSDLTGADGTATVVECAEFGPLSARGAGYYWKCAAEVRTGPDRAPVEVEFGPDELTPADLGQQVFVDYDAHDWQRNVPHPYDFLAVIGLVAVGGLGFIGYGVGPEGILKWLVPTVRRDAGAARAPAEPESLDLPVDLKLPVPDGGDRTGSIAAFVFFAATGIGFLVVAGTMIVATARLRPDDIATYLVTLPFLLPGVGLLAVIPSARRRLRVTSGASLVPARLTSRGFEQTARDGSPRRIHWSRIKRFVFVERPGDLVEVHLTIVGEKKDEDLAAAFCVRSDHGYLLTPFLRLREAEHLSAVVENFKPGLTRWPTREVARGGLGLIRPAKSTVVRLKDASSGVSTEKRISASRPSLVRMTVMLLGATLLTWSLVTAASGQVAMDRFVITAVVLVYLAASLYRGRRGIFVLRKDSLSWRERDHREVKVLYADIDNVVVKPAPPGNGRWYYSLHVVPSDEDEYVLVERVGAAAARRVVDLVQPRPATTASLENHS
ncbi:DUF6346 domain-containing protein [Amycolatopsis azurea]|uniref:Uncharacterized protein n=1 Tax=Amycolatopsis azurea DSM 43854 TaxID=1238180 RepID=M2PTV6_9PSEU|nr:DUF6346 domain-containing protein [Amycolatopsis azurea]EMD28013.1 hypothetical protein C791_1465 [Amycolatopsis azurea DSM 43854]OOC05390.1 hypothetical protein B0293_18305 [Amycolatopsis azurea DSM 43854]